MTLCDFPFHPARQKHKDELLCRAAFSAAHLQPPHNDAFSITCRTATAQRRFFRRVPHSHHTVAAFSAACRTATAQRRYFYRVPHSHRATPLFRRAAFPPRTVPSPRNAAFSITCHTATVTFTQHCSHRQLPPKLQSRLRHSHGEAVRRTRLYQSRGGGAPSR